MAIKMKAPANIAEAHGMSGNHYKVDENGFIYVTEATDVSHLLNAGFMHAPLDEQP